jgi:flagellar hook protein FlgE
MYLIMMKAMQSAVTGLRAQQTAMDIIGNNIANVNTAGFKSSVVNFSDLFYQTLNGGTESVNPSQVGYGAQVSTVSKNMSSVGATTTDNYTDLYVDGGGYFTMNTKADGTGQNYYTRVGNFHFTPNGYLVDNSTGNFVMSTLSDATGNYSAVRLNNVSLVDSSTTPPTVTPINDTNFGQLTKISINSDGSIGASLNDANGKVMVQTGYAIDSAAVTAAAQVDSDSSAANSAATAADATATAVDGAKVTADKNKVDADALKATKDALAATADAAVITTKAAKDAATKAVTDATKAQADALTDKNTKDGTTTAAKTARDAVATTDPTYAGLDATYQAAKTISDAADTAYTNTGLALTAANNALIAPTNAYNTAVTNAITPDSDAANADSAAKTADNAANLADAAAVAADADKATKAAAAVKLATAKIKADFAETIAGNPANYTLQQAQISVFLNPDGLTEVGNNCLMANSSSGAPSVTTAGGADGTTIKSGELEMSNVDLAKEFTNMITTQRGFQANSRVITVSDTLLEELINLKRS